MNLIKRTDMNTRKQSHNIIFGFAGMSFLLLTIFPQTLWASGNESIALSRFLEVLELILGDRPSASYHNSSFAERHNYRGNERYGEYRPVVNPYYRDRPRSTYYEDHRTSRYYRQYSRKRHHPKHKHCRDNRHRQQYYNEYSGR